MPSRIDGLRAGRRISRLALQQAYRLMDARDSPRNIQQCSMYRQLGINIIFYYLQSNKIRLSTKKVRTVLQVKRKRLSKVQWALDHFPFLSLKIYANLQPAHPDRIVYIRAKLAGRIP